MILDAPWGVGLLQTSTGSGNTLALLCLHVKPWIREEIYHIFIHGCLQLVWLIIGCSVIIS